MFRIIAFLLLMFMILPGRAQKISYSYYAYVRAGFSNTIGFSADFKYDSIRFKMNGKICDADSNSVNIYPKRPGKDTLYSKAYLDGSIVYTGEFVLDVMKPEVFGVFKPSLQTKLQLNLIKEFPGVSFKIKVNNYHWESVDIVSYRLSIIRINQIIFSVIETSNRFSDFAMNELEKIKVGDLIMISEIKVTDFYKQVADPMPTIYEVEF